MDVKKGQSTIEDGRSQPIDRDQSPVSSYQEFRCTDCEVIFEIPTIRVDRDGVKFICPNCHYYPIVTNKDIPKGHSITASIHPSSIDNCDRCGICLFWKRKTSHAGVESTKWGRCRFNPPNVLGIDKTWYESEFKTMIWPDTHETDWCGKFQSRKSEIMDQKTARRVDVATCPNCLTENHYQVGSKKECCFQCGYLFATDDDVRQSSAVIRDLLLQVDVDVPVEAIMTWTCEQRNQAEDWAAAIYNYDGGDTSDIPPKPAFLPHEK